MIPHEAIKAAARVMHAKDVNDGYGDYASEEYTEDARRILEATAPYLMAAAWDEGMEAMYATTSSEWPPIPEANPYRSAGAGE
jgi:hypothetical protein